jgi:pSer/pThr/pTyr-binding forkhead associated (FHA) protein
VEKLSHPPCLILKTGHYNPKIPLINQNYWTIGRHDHNDISLPDRCVSRNHAILKYRKSQEFVLTDLGSHNGTFVNGKRLKSPMVLKHQDLVILGKTTLQFYYPNDLKSVFIPKNSWKIGRNPDNDLIIPDYSVSRYHAILEHHKTQGFLWIDIGSRNGSFVNGKRVKKATRLNHRDVVTFGQTTLEFCSLAHPKTVRAFIFNTSFSTTCFFI